MSTPSLFREAAVLALVPLAAATVRRRGWRNALPWLATPVPLVLWWTWVRARVGQWPFLDPSPSRRDALSWPLGGVVQVVREGTTALTHPHYRWVVARSTPRCH